jgi:rhomboid protease GluP
VSETQASGPSIPASDPAPVPIGPRRRPWISYTLLALCVGLTLLLWSLPEGANWTRLGLSSGHRVYGGHYWSLLVSAFAHGDILHLLFNGYWLVLMGGYIELRYGRAFYLLFVLLAAVASSAVQLSASGQTGIGFSGVAYAYFGFLWATKLFAREPHPLINGANIRLFVGWFVLCIVLTETGHMSIGNFAHGAGLVFGFVAGFAVSRRHGFGRMAVPALLALVAATLVYSPWNQSWLAARAIDAHRERRFEEAIEFYSAILRKEPDDTWALRNRARLLRHVGQTADADRDDARLKELDRN